MYGFDFMWAGDGELVGTMELEQAEAERANLLDGIKTRTTKANKVATLLPRAAERYQAVVNDLACLSKRHVAQAREQIRKLVGEIRLAPTADCYLEAVLTGRMKGVEAGDWGQVK
jgi:ribosomal protein L17